jgi:O-antigen ligase
MRAIALALSLVFSFMIPWEGVIRVASLGNGSKVMGLVLAAFWLLTVLVTQRLRRPGPFQVAAYLFVLWNAASVFWSANPNATLNHVITWAQLLVQAMIWWDLYTTHAAVLAGLQTFVLGAYVAIAGAIVNFFSGDAFYSHYDRYSPGETNPDGFGFIMVLAIPLAWYLATSAPPSRLGGLWGVINYGYIPTAMLGIALSGTRTALIASLPGMIFGLTTLTRIRPLARVTIFLLFTLAVILLLPHVQNERSFQRFSTTASELTEGDLNNRTNIWLEGVVAFADHPLFGIGSNMYPSINRWDKAAHNSFLAILVELGIIGFALFAILLTLVLTEAWRLPKWDSRFWLTTLFVWFIGASTLTWGHRKPTWLLFNLVIASAAIARQRDEAASPLPHSEPERPAIPPPNPGRWRPGAKEKPYFV